MKVYVIKKGASIKYAELQEATDKGSRKNRGSISRNTDCKLDTDMRFNPNSLLVDCIDKDVATKELKDTSSTYYKRIVKILTDNKLETPASMFTNTILGWIAFGYTGFAIGNKCVLLVKTKYVECIQ